MTEKMRCDCANLAHTFSGNDEHNPFGDLNEVEWSPQRWASLMQCPYCEQLWHIEMAKQGTQGVCAKVASTEAWGTFDSDQEKIKQMVATRGGLTWQTCQWKQCEEYCLKGLAFCPQHAYFEMGIEQ